MVTHHGAVIDKEDLVATFEFEWVSCPIGRFDPEDYPHSKYPGASWSELGTEVMTQLAESGMFTVKQLETIAFMDSRSFLNCIVDK